MGETISLYRRIKPQGTKRIVIGGEFNAKSYLWGPDTIQPDKTGHSVMNWMTEDNIQIINEFPSSPTHTGFRNSRSWIDLTLSRDAMLKWIHDWSVEEKPAEFSDHRMIEFTMGSHSQLHLRSQQSIGGVVIGKLWKKSSHEN